MALAKAEILTKPDFTVVQAFMLFLVLVRRHDDTRFAWTLTGLLIRLSQALGLHRDGTHFPNLTPFEIEMRRRLFWAVCVLDLRSAEDQGTDLSIVSGTFDTQMPLNINDSDLYPDMPYLPEPRAGTTDMAFSLIRYEVCSLSRRLHTISSGGLAPAHPGDADKTLEQREDLLREVSERVEQRLLKDRSNSMFWVASNITHVIVAKMTLIIYQPVLFARPSGTVLSDEVRARLFNAALEVFEYSHVLNTDPRCKHWRWLFQTWSHWHALAYTLVEVSHRPWGPKAERAWAALNLTFQSPTNPAELERLASHHAVWMPMRKLYIKVKKHREAEIARLRADPQAARELDLQDQPIAPPTSFGAIPASMKRAIAIERWRKLVNLPAPPSQEIMAQQQLMYQQQQQLQQQQQQQQQQPLPQLPQQPERSKTLPAQLTGTAMPMQPDFTKPEVMEYLDAAMANPTFLPTDLWALWPSDTPAAAVPDGTVYPQGAAYPPGTGADPSRPVDASAMGYDAGTPAVSEMGQMSRTPTTGTMPMAHLPPQQQTMGQTPMNNNGASGTGEENLPPWLWPTNGSPDIMRMPPYMAAEDMEMDTAMDEGFDWQGWQESLGRYEAETGGGRAGSTWGPVL